MKKSCKKILSLIIAMALLMFSVVPALASGSDPTTWTPTSAAANNTKKEIKVRDAVGASAVRAYQIVKGTYKDGKLTGYELCDSTNAYVADIANPTSTEITTIANNIQSGEVTLDYVKMRYLNGAFTAEVEAGEYIILVSFSGRYVYNPAVVSVNVTDANLVDSSSVSGGEVNMNTQFSAGDTAYMKKSDTEFIKYIVVGDSTSQSTTASYGDSVGFKLMSMTIPSYSDDYASPLIFRIIDDLNPDRLSGSPFLGVTGLTVKVGGSVVHPATGEGAEAVTNYTVTYYKDDGVTTTEDPTKAAKYKIEFADDFIRANVMKAVEVTYSSTFTNNAKLALQDYSSEFVSNMTAPTLQYSNNPTDKDSYCNLLSYTETFTFGIDVVGDGIQTYELNKVSEAGADYEPVKDENNNEITQKSKKALAGATFTIYSDAAMNNVITTVGTNGTSISDANGHVEFRGLGEGTYYLKETSAPEGYTLNKNNYKIRIGRSNRFGGIYSYSVTTYLMGDTDTQIGSATYYVDANPRVTPAEVVNTQLVSLPTTGGVGTIIIAIVAGVGMAVFLTIFVISKKKRSKKQG